jgi:hypothetical protein
VGVTGPLLAALVAEVSYRLTESPDGTWHSRNRSWRRIDTARRREITDIPPRFRNFTLEDLPNNTVGRKVRGWANRWGEFPNSGLPLDDYDNNRGRGLWLWGSPGTGKTRTASIAANHISDLGWTTRFSTVTNLHDLSLWPMRAADDKERETYQFLFDCWDAGWDGWRCAVLDDMGKEHKTASGWVQDVLDSLIRNRFNSGAPTIVTTNLRPNQVGKTYNPSMEDFINEAFFVIEVTGETHRGR